MNSTRNKIAGWSFIGFAGFGIGVGIVEVGKYVIEVIGAMCILWGVPYLMFIAHAAVGGV